MRTWRYLGVHRLAWVLIALLVVAVAVFAMAAGFSRLRQPVPPPPAASWEFSRPAIVASVVAEQWLVDPRPRTVSPIA